MLKAAYNNDAISIETGNAEMNLVAGMHTRCEAGSDLDQISRESIELLAEAHSL